MVQLYKIVPPDAERVVLLIRLHQLGVATFKQGVPIEKLSYADLKRELVMASIRKEGME